MRKIYFVATTPTFFNFFNGQLRLLSRHFETAIISKNINNKLEGIAKREKALFYEVNIERPISIFLDIKALLQLYRLFKKDRPDIVHGNTPKGSLLSMLAARFSGVKQRVYMCHGLRFQSEKGLFKYLLMMIEKLTCYSATKVLCVSEGVKSTLVENKLCSKEKAIVIGNGSCNGINMDYFNPSAVSKIEIDEIAKLYNINKSDFIFSFVGRFVKDKGVYELVKAFDNINKKNKRTSLVIIGSIGEYDSCFDEIKEDVGVNQNIKFVGVQKDIRPFLSLSDVLVLPSYREGFGMVLAEAGAMSIPVVASDIVGCNNVVIEGVNGVFCEPKDVNSLERSMLLLMDNLKLYSTIKDKTRISTAERFEQKKVWELYQNFYINLK